MTGVLGTYPGKMPKLTRRLSVIISMETENESEWVGEKAA